MGGSGGPWGVLGWQVDSAGWGQGGWGNGEAGGVCKRVEIGGLMGSVGRLGKMGGGGGCPSEGEGRGRERGRG